MWIAEYKVWHPGGAGIELTKKYEVSVRIYTLNVYHEKEFGVSKVIAVNGKEWKEYINDWMKLEGHRMHFVKNEGNLLFYTYPQPDKNYASLVMAENLFFLRPILVRNGYEYWTVASFDKKNLTDLPKRGKKIRSRAVFRLISIHEDTTGLFLSGAAGSLSPNQLEAFLNAVDFGYYGYPRKTDLKLLAKKMSLSESTYREHLRKAEEKLMPAVASQIGKR